MRFTAWQDLVGNKNLSKCTLGCIPLCAGTGAAFQVYHFGFCLSLCQQNVPTALYLQFWTGTGVTASLHLCCENAKLEK